MTPRRALILIPSLLALLAAPAHGDTPGGVQAKNKTVDGEKVYKQICAACHMPNAMGSGGGAIPALAKNRKMADPAYPIGILMKGKGAMPPMNDMLSPAQVAAVIAYVRTNFGNAYPQPVTEADVKRIAKPGRSME
ncbi:cytochrome c [Sphingobium sp. TA15]|uniref:Putative cytochrome c n=1 Tax=Sphingobium indicum (strain DSM 16413 / CCM 7287 / MTCC 6362 / UT26 / NBRC 101211 / UT26S) TaxID=452662 RepID=D4Z7S8_SPHIU|nr:cytochrome c [Sphingobium indicum]BAI98547.1 putative cytochrome c [Sphingobium indicum UT26S]BDD68601.1 cytochrome c [Sphingobium sp. TA15]